jgi:hypothetical protein
VAVASSDGGGCGGRPSSGSGGQPRIDEGDEDQEDYAAFAEAPLTARR